MLEKGIPRSHTEAASVTEAERGLHIAHCSLLIFHWGPIRPASLGVSAHFPSPMCNVKCAMNNVQSASGPIRPASLGGRGIVRHPDRRCGAGGRRYNVVWAVSAHFPSPMCNVKCAMNNVQSASGPIRPASLGAWGIVRHPDRRCGAGGRRYNVVWAVSAHFPPPMCNVK